MNHKMKLQPKYYDFILNGTKRIEIRLNDEKRRIIKWIRKILFKRKTRTIWCIRYWSNFLKLEKFGNYIDNYLKILYD